MMKNLANGEKSSARKRSASKNIHVVLHSEGWVVRSEGSTRVDSHHETRREAVEAARTRAESDAATLVIHRRDGRVKERISYNPDPLPPRKPPKVLFPTTPPKNASREAIRKAVREVVSEREAKEKDSRILRRRESQSETLVGPKKAPARRS